MLAACIIVVALVDGLDLSGCVTFVAWRSSTSSDLWFLPIPSYLSLSNPIAPAQSGYLLSNLEQGGGLVYFGGPRVTPGWMAQWRRCPPA
jgi:hypothetical protein